MIGIIFIIMGFFCTTLNLYLPSSHIYPAYEETASLGTVVQTYVIENMLRGRFNYGVLIDIAGYAFLLAGCVLLIKYSKGFIKGGLCVIITATFHILLVVMPFYMNGRQLTVTALAVSFLLMVSQVYMGYRIIYAITEVTLAIHNDANVRYVKMGFIGASIWRVILYFLNLVGLDVLSWFYQAAMYGFMLFCLINVYRSLDGLSDFKKGFAKEGIEEKAV